MHNKKREHVKYRIRDEQVRSWYKKNKKKEKCGIIVIDYPIFPHLQDGKIGFLSRLLVVLDIDHLDVVLIGG